MLILINKVLLVFLNIKIRMFCQLSFIYLDIIYLSDVIVFFVQFCEQKMDYLTFIRKHRGELLNFYN